MLPKYVSLILDCENEDKKTKEDSLLKILRWKDFRQQFWAHLSKTELSAYCEGTIGEIFIAKSEDVSPEFSSDVFTIGSDYTPHPSDDIFRELLGINKKKREDTYDEENVSAESGEFVKSSNNEFGGDGYENDEEVKGESNTVVD